MKFTKVRLAVLLALIITSAGYFNSENNLLPHYYGLEFISKVISLPFYIFVTVSFGLLAFTETLGYILMNFFGWIAILFLIFRKIENSKIFLSAILGLILSLPILLYSFISFYDYKSNRIVHCLNGTLQSESYNRNSAHECLDSKVFNLLYKNEPSPRVLIDLGGEKFSEAVTFCKSLPDMKVTMSDHRSTVLDQSDNSNDFCFYTLGFRVLNEEGRKVPDSSDKHLTSIINTVCSHVKSDIDKCRLFFTEYINNSPIFRK